MIVYALIGSSGTGKSHHAPLLAHEKNIPLILDDGLLIQNNQIVAGHSAKRERTRYGAAKRALLTDYEHAEKLRQKVWELKPEKLLILATSFRMAKKIAERLEIPAPHHYLTIEEIADPEEITRALKIREKENRHALPLPTFAIKKEFPGYLVAPLRSFFTRPAEQKNLSIERSIVRPIYSTLGNFFIAEHVISDLAAYLSREVPVINRVNKVMIYPVNSSSIGMDIELVLTLVPDLKEILIKHQRYLKERIELITGFHLDRVNLVAKKLSLPIPEADTGEVGGENLSVTGERKA